MNIDELFTFRDEIIEKSKDEDGFVQQSNILNEVIPEMHLTKLLDSEDFTPAYYYSDLDNVKLNAFARNDSGERLQLFILDEDTIKEGGDREDLLVSLRSDYDHQFKRVLKLLKKVNAKSLTEHTQDSHPIKPLMSYLTSDEGLLRIDVIEIFLISLTGAVTSKGGKTERRDDVFFENEEFSVLLSGKNKKNILIKKYLINLNFISNVFSSKGGRQPLTIKFNEQFPEPIEVLLAASESTYKSYLCILSGETIKKLYREYGARLLEKNVRSFLQFKGVNKGMKATIKNEPEKFIAYNNGLTITAKEIKVYDSKKKTYLESLVDFQIVNGGQTTASIYFSSKEGLDIKDVKVMAKINVVENEDEDKLENLISNISKFSNSQSRVSNVDLRSRNAKLIQLKRLSETVVSPSGKLWFFERAKGEFHTLVRKHGISDSLIKKKYPQDRRFSKELLAKYFSAWGDIPFHVKKGGEKIFRIFIEAIEPEDRDKHIVVDREFYEIVIAQILLFRTMEKIYGSRQDSIGQLRSAVVPYSISMIYLNTDYVNRKFNFQKIWKDEKIDSDQELFLKKLMELMNDLIKKYSKSDDYGENSKKEELWIDIKNCKEIKDFFSSKESDFFLKRYSIKRS